MTLEEKYKALQSNPYFKYFSIKSEWENKNKSPEQLKAEFSKQKILHAENTKRCKNPFGDTKGEGVVVKDQTYLNKQASVFYVKVVSEEFQETNKARQVIKTFPLDQICKQEKAQESACSIVTKARVRKMLLQCIDNGEMSPNWKSLSVNEVTKVVKGRVYKDCLKEEKEMVESIGSAFGKYCNNLTKQYLQELRTEEEYLA